MWVRGVVVRNGFLGEAALSYFSKEREDLDREKDRNNSVKEGNAINPDDP